MPANWELQLISAVVRDPESPARFTQASQSGVTTSIFSNAEARAVWSGIEYHYNRPDIFGHVPSEALLLEQYGNLDLPNPQECFEDLVNLVKTKHVGKRADTAIEEYQFAKRENPQVALLELYTALSAIQEQTNQGTDQTFSERALFETMEELQALERTSGVMGMPYPWERLNTATGGINPGDFILLYALPKSMKTWIGLVIAVHLARTGRSVLVYSKEMMWETMRRRIACLLARMDYGKYRKNLLSDTEKGLILEALEWFETECAGEIHFTTADRADGSPGGPAEIRRKMDIYQPQFVVLDSAYMLELPNNHTNPYDWKSLALVNRQLKQIAKTTGIPVLAILQENERAAFKYKGTRGTASLAMNTSAIQDCDLSIRVVYNKRREEISLHLPAARETTDDGFTIHARAAEDFSYAHDRLWEVGEDAQDEPSQGQESESGNAAIQNAILEFGTMVSQFQDSGQGDESEDEDV